MDRNMQGNASRAPISSTRSEQEAATAMRIGVPKEIKVHEDRVGIVPAGVRELCARGHEVLVERAAGLGIGLSDEA